MASCPSNAPLLHLRLQLSASSIFIPLFPDCPLPLSLCRASELDYTLAFIYISLFYCCLLNPSLPLIFFFPLICSTVLSKFSPILFMSPCPLAIHPVALCTEGNCMESHGPIEKDIWDQFRSIFKALLTISPRLRLTCCSLWEF